MSFVNATFLGQLLIALAILAIVLIYYEKRFFSWLSRFFFLKRSKRSYLSSFLFFVALSGIGISALDLRGPEESVTANVVDQKTILLIDGSASMLAEDIRPNRFEKSLMMARHFVKKAIGHQIAVVIFSDTQKRVVPFTDDVDLLDARIAALSTMDLRYGGSNLATAVMESIQYFISDSGKSDFLGNLLVFTDSEDHDELALKVPDSVHLAIVGVGTLSGSTIPLRNDNGQFLGNKTADGKEVVTKLNEDYLKKISNVAKHYRYWIALSYSIPTEEIIDFFRNLYKSKISKGEMKSRPVYSHFILAASIAVYIIALLLRWGKSASMALVLLLLLDQSANASEDLMKSLGDGLKEGRLALKEKQKLAELYLKNGEEEKALSLYKESIPQTKDTSTESLFNYGSLLLKNGRFKEGLSYYEAIKERTNDEELLSKMRNNLQLAFKQKEEQQEKKEEQKEGEKKEDQKKGEDKKENEQKQNEKKNEQKNQSKSDQKKDGDKKQEPQKSDDQKKEQEQKKEEQPKEKSETLEEYENKLRQQKNMVKVPAIMKQLLNEDRDLQKKYLDTTEDRKMRSRDKKDW